MSEWTEDVYFKKRIHYNLHKQDFDFDVAELLFSSHEIDLGTQFLLRRLLELDLQPTSILDLGCGYGVIGIVLARFFPQARVVLSDKDLLAVEYTQHNIEVNHIKNAQVYPSISVDDLPPAQYDLIVSNVPGHIGDVAIEQDFVLKPYQQLTPGGTYVMVVVHPLKAIIERVAAEHNLHLVKLAERTAHTVYSLQRNEER